MGDRGPESGCQDDDGWMERQVNEDAQAERLAEAIDRIVLEGGEVAPEEEDLSPLLSLAAELQHALPPVHADPAFQGALRVRLLAAPGKVSGWQRILHLVRANPQPGEERTDDSSPRLGVPASPRPRVSQSPRRPWLYAGSLAAAALVLVGSYGAYFALSHLSQQAQTAAPMAAPMAAAPAAAATGAASRPEGTARATAALPAPMAAEAPPTGAAAGPRSLAQWPVLPPLSASTPRVMIWGLGGGSLGGSGEEPARQIRFELATSLPNLGATTTVYRYRMPVLDLDKARSLAAKLGFDPAQLRPIESAGEVAAYVISDQSHGSLEIQTAGATINYSTGGGTAPGQNAPALPSDTEAIRSATQWLSNLQLLPPGVAEPQVEIPFPQAPFKEVTFRPAQPANLVASYPSIRLSVLPGGTVANLHWAWAEQESSLDYPARTAESAWDMVKAGKAQMLFQGEHSAPDFQGTVRITSVESGYTMTFALDDRPYLQPVVIFRGESAMAGNPSSRPFTALVPQVDDSALPDEKVTYLLTGSLPALSPDEGVALQQAPVEPPAAEWVRELGRKLGLAGEPRLLGKDGPPGVPLSWEMADARGRWVLRVSADRKALQGWGELWSFGRIGEDQAPASGKAPTGEAAIRIAEEFLKRSSLYTPDLGQPRAQQASPDGSRSIVIFEGNVEGLPVRDSGVMSLTLNDRGEVQNIVSNQHSMQVVKRGKILTPEQALKAIQTGKGKIEVESLFNRTIYSGRAEIEKVELAYRVVEPQPQAGGRLPTGDEPPPVRLEPYYIFTGTIEVGESHKRLPFTTSLLAWAP